MIQTPQVKYNIFLSSYLNHFISQANLHLNIFSIEIDGQEKESFCFLFWLSPTESLYLGKDIKSNINHNHKTKTSWQDDFVMYLHNKFSAALL